MLKSSTVVQVRPSERRIGQAVSSLARYFYSHDTQPGMARELWYGELE